MITPLTLFQCWASQRSNVSADVQYGAMGLTVKKRTGYTTSTPPALVYIFCRFHTNRTNLREAEGNATRGRHALAESSLTTHLLRRRATVLTEAFADGRSLVYCQRLCCYGTLVLRTSSLTGSGHIRLPDSPVDFDFQPHDLDASLSFQLA